MIPTEDKLNNDELELLFTKRYLIFSKKCMDNFFHNTLFVWIIFNKESGLLTVRPSNDVNKYESDYADDELLCKFMNNRKTRVSSHGFYNKFNPSFEKSIIIKLFYNQENNWLEGYIK